MEENKNQPRHKVDIREMTIDDETTLRQICDRCEDALAGCGERISDQEVHDIVRKKVLPPEGKSEKYHAKLITFDGEPAGFMTYYEGYPFGTHRLDWFFLPCSGSARAIIRYSDYGDV